MDANPLRLDVTLVNLAVPEAADARFRYLKEDVRTLDWMQDRAFDVAFSNSLIEHLGDLSAQAQAVAHMKRVAGLLYLQTPNRGFLGTALCAPVRPLAQSAGPHACIIDPEPDVIERPI